MDPNPLKVTLDTLRLESHTTELRAGELRDELDILTQRLRNLHGAIENIEALLRQPGEDDQPESTYDAGHPRPEEEDSSRLTPQVNDSSSATDVEPPSRKRVPSTDWVADVVNAIGRPADRDTIYKKFEEMKGMPVSWVSNPRNSFNNALGRAAVRKMILKFGENEFAPVGYKPSADEDSDTSEEQ